MRKTLILFLLSSVLLAACGPTGSLPSTFPTAIPASTLSPDEQAVTDLVAEFGSKLQQVSLLASDAAEQMQQLYAPYVTPDLLHTWQADPTQAPGRLTSSPWPDHIEIETLQKESADEYSVSVLVIEGSSADNNSDNMLPGSPVGLTVTRSNGQWLISAYHLIDPTQ